MSQNILSLYAKFKSCISVFHCADLPVMSVFEEQKEQNSSQRQEETTKVNMADLEDGEIIEKETKIEEEKRERLLKV